MISTNLLATDTRQEKYSFFKARRERRHGVCVVVLVALLGAGTLIVYHTGGTAYAYPYLMLVPVLLASAWYRLAGGIVTAAVAGGLMAVMPLDGDQGIAQETSNWLLRLSLYLGLGAFSGTLFQSIYHLNRGRERLMSTDQPSGLPNSLALRSQLAANLRTRRENDNVTLVLMRVVDIADVLEALGIDASDELMAAIGHRIMASTPASARLYRFSNSEIMLMLPEADRPESDRIVRHLVDAGEDNVIVQGMPMRAQMVFGSSTAAPETTAEGLISEARMAMFAAIEKGISHQTYTSALRRRTLETIQLISRVREGLDKQEFELHYQPKIRLADDAVSGCEGLIRWRDGTGGFIPPGRFMPKVESTSLISPVTHFVMAEAVRFAQACTGVVSLNFSGHNLLDHQLTCRLKALLEESGLPAERLEIEITESVLMQNLQAARQAIQTIRSFGIGVSIDDFGTGFASFEYLRHLPVTGLKIDQVFMTDLETDEKARKLMACMIDVGQALGLEVTAEGVETTGQRDILKSLGCKQAQGFLYSPALSVSDYAEWTENRNKIGVGK